MDTRVIAGPYPYARLRVRLHPIPQSAGIARTFVRHHLISLGFPDLVENGCLIASELVTNAIAAAPDDCCFCYVQPNGGSPLTEVWDTCLGSPTPKDEGLDAISGRGLMITAALAADWGWHFPRPDHGGGKVTWARLVATSPNGNGDASRDR